VVIVVLQLIRGRHPGLFVNWNDIHSSASTARWFCLQSMYRPKPAESSTGDWF